MYRSWVLEATVEMFEHLKQVFEAIVAGQAFQAHELPQPSIAERTISRPQGLGLLCRPSSDSVPSFPVDFQWSNLPTTFAL